MALVQILSILVLIVGRLQQDHAAQDQDDSDNHEQDEEHGMGLFCLTDLASGSQLEKAFVD